MKLISTQTIFGVITATLLGITATCQTPPTRSAAALAKKPAVVSQRTLPRKPATARPRQLMAEQVYKNIKVLRGLTEDQFMDTMSFISGGLGTNCVHCHSTAIAGSTSARWAGFAVDTPLKETARQMMAMVNRINNAYFAGEKAVTCYTCHRGLEDPPKVIPELALQYGTPVDGEPDQFARQDPNSPSPEEVLNRYIQAIGGNQRVDSLKSYVAKGTYSGYDTDFEAVPIDIYGKAPNQHASVIHTAFGERSRVFDGRLGWNAAPDTSQVKTVLPITAGRLENEKIMAQLLFPSQTKTFLTRLVTSPEMTIGGGDPGAKDLPDRQVYVVQGFNARRLPVKLYFDKESGLLVRVVTNIDTALGIITSEIDYSDYRDVSGIKIPFHWIVTATDGQNIYDLTGVEINANIDDARFKEPAPPKLLTPVSNVALAQ